MGASFSKQPVAGAQEGSAHWAVLGKFGVGTPEDLGFFLIIPEFGVEVTYVTSEAFLFARIIGGHNGK